jgi:alpha-beta hydrolase superfamily lysophospholipase
MHKTLALTALVSLAIGVAAAALLLALRSLGGPEDPAVAPCLHPATTMSRSRVVGDHRELDVGFTCNGARLAGTLFVPRGAGRHPAVVWLHGSGETPRLSYGTLVASYVQDGIVFFSYDKRGVGESDGQCCPDERGHFNLVTSDAVGAVAAVRTSPAVDAARVGFLGASAAGWVAPRATEQSGHVRFVAIASPGVLRHSIVARFEQEAAGSDRSAEAIARDIPSWRSSGFDPAPSLERLGVPALWLFGGADRNVPAVLSAETLRRIGQRHGKDWKIVVFRGAGHGLLDDPPTDRRAGPLAEAWIRRQVGSGGGVAGD